MGTLTADMPRLAEHCPHKLATSCRLTSTPNCCACADERSHSNSYSVYIDGVGFVQRGTRWQSYCWFCKEFWNNRIAATDPPLAISQTRIPQFPDQSEFLERWTEFHQGYRIVKAADGSESRIAVVGEPFKDVSPGFLPRTINELRLGQQNDATRASNRTTRVATSMETTSTIEPHRTIEEELDDLLLDGDNEEVDREPLTGRLEPSSEIQRQLRERRAERRSTERMRRVWGTREDIESDDYMSPITGMFTRTVEWHRRQMERLRSSEAAPLASSSNPREDSTASRTQHTAQATPPNPSESIAARSYEATLTRLQEALRQTNALQGRIRAQVAEADQQPSFEDRRRQIDSFFPYLQQVEAIESEGTPNDWRDRADSEDWSQAQVIALQEAQRDLRTAQLAATMEIQRHVLSLQRVASAPPPLLPTTHLDNDDNRPEPKTDAEKMVKLECKICYQQIASMACVPCGHLVMCEWCADIHMPVKHRNVPEVPSQCPMCRKKVSHRVKIHVG